MNKKVVIIGLVALAGIGLYFLTKKKKDEAVLAETNGGVLAETNEEEQTTNSAGQVQKSDWNKILKKGSKGNEVKVLQKALKQVDVDGDFGSGTEKRLIAVTGLNQISVNQYNTFINAKIAKNLASEKTVNWNKVLKKGSKGIEVELLQKSIKQVDVNGNFDTKTEERLKKVVGLNQVSLSIYNDLIRKNAKKAQQMNAVFAQQGNTTSFTTGLI
jgi:LPXTG-motif cell wall-anchored protein